MMELDFDKEIDALLRKEGAGRTITISEFSGMHLDADEIAAFAEGAVPQRARQTFTEHFAACDQCRKTLSNLILLNDANEPELAAAAAAPVELTIPWYRRLLLFPNFAYVMGGLVILFAGFIGLSIMTQSFQNGQSEMSQVSTNRAAETEPVYTNTNAANMVSTAAPEVNNSAAANSASNVPVPYESNRLIAAANSPAQRDLPAERKDEPKSSAFSVDGADARQSRPVTAAPPPSASQPEDRSVTSDVVVTQVPAKEKKADREQLAEMQKVRPASTPAGPPVPVSRDQQSRSRAVMKSPAPAGGTANAANTVSKKEVRGRTFEFRQGAWYDTTYRGQGTINVRRNTEEYRKLDQGLRGIAESFIGTVVTLWNGKAYRIQ